MAHEFQQAIRDGPSQAVFAHLLGRSMATLGSLNYMKNLLARCLLSAVLIGSVASAGEEAKKIYFKKLENKSIYVVIESSGGKKVLNLVGVRLKPQTDSYIELLEEGDSFLSGLLSPDGSRILVSLGHIDEKNVWVVNLKTSTLEFESHENVGRHLFPKWLDVSRFELMYGGMGYRVEQEFKLSGNAWKLIRDKTFDQ
jgi:hypothetical protein